MNVPYFELVKAVFPNAKIVTDRFHIVQQITRALNQLRIKTMNSFQKMEPTKYRRLKRFWKLLLKMPTIWIVPIINMIDPFVDQ